VAAIRLGRLFACALLPMLALAGWASGAHGASAAEAGWWTALPIALVPDAPTDAIVVQGGPGANQPIAYGAVRYTLEPGEAPVSMTLQLASGATSTPNATLAVCPLTEQFAPAQGGPMASAPTYECSTKVTALLAPDGASYEFAVGELARDGVLALAVLPTAPTDRVIFAWPASDSLKSVQATSAEVPVPAPVATGGATASESPLDVAFDDSTGLTAGPIDLPSLNSPHAPAVASPAAPAAPRGSAQPVTPPAAPPVRTAGERSWPPVLFVGLVVVAAALWGVTGSRGDEESEAAQAPAT
jgi:hypothetical protein